MEVLSQGPFAVGVVTWQPRPGAHVLTVVCKATFQLAERMSILAPAAAAVVPFDAHAGNDPRRSLVAPSDLVPYKLCPEVFVTGHVHAHTTGRGVSQLTARVAIGEMDKAVLVSGDRYFTLDGELHEGAPFTQMPMAWERAAGGPDTSNPAGVITGSDARVDPWGRIFVPNLLPPGTVVTSRLDVIAPVGMGPIASTWPSRRARLMQHAATWDPIRWSARPLPFDLDGTYFQVAPADQRVDEIAPDERILLENLHPEAPELVTRLPGVVLRAVVHTEVGVTQIPLRCDTLAIDADRGTATAVYRGQIPIDHPQRAGRVVVSQETSSQVAVPAAWAPPPPPEVLHETGGYRPPPPERLHETGAFRPPPPPERLHETGTFRPPPPPEKLHGTGAFRPPPPPEPLRDNVQEALSSFEPAQRARIEAAISRLSNVQGDADSTVVLGPESARTRAFAGTLVVEDDTSEARSRPAAEEPIPPIAPPKPVHEEPGGDTSALPFRPVMGAKVGGSALGRSMRLAPVSEPVAAPEPVPPPAFPEPGIETLVVPPRPALVAPPAIVSPGESETFVVPPAVSGSPVYTSPGEPFPVPSAVPRLPVYAPPPDVLVAPPAVLGPPIEGVEPARPPGLGMSLGWSPSEPAPGVSGPVFVPPPTPEGEAPLPPSLGVAAAPPFDIADEPTDELSKAPAAPAEGPREPELPLAEYDLERCARIEASLARRPGEADIVLEEHGLSPETWEKLQAHHGAAIDEEARRGKIALLTVQDAAYIAQIESERGPIDAALYARIKISVQRGTAQQVLQEAGIPRSALVRLQRTWLRRTLADKALAAETKAALRAARSA